MALGRAPHSSAALKSNPCSFFFVLPRPDDAMCKACHITPIHRKQVFVHTQNERNSSGPWKWRAAERKQKSLDPEKKIHGERGRRAAAPRPRPEWRCSREPPPPRPLMPAAPSFTCSRCFRHQGAAAAAAAKMHLLFIMVILGRRQQQGSRRAGPALPRGAAQARSELVDLRRRDEGVGLGQALPVHALVVKGAGVVLGVAVRGAEDVAAAARGGGGGGGRAAPGQRTDPALGGRGGRGARRAPKTCGAGQQLQPAVPHPYYPHCSPALEAQQADLLVAAEAAAAVGLDRLLGLLGGLLPAG